MRKLFDEQIMHNEHFECHQDWEVAIVGFFIIEPKRDYRSFSDMTDIEAVSFMDILRRVREAQKEVLGIDDIYVFQNEDTKHAFHVWMFPRHDWMESFGRKIESVKPIMLHAENNYTDEMVTEVRKACCKVREYLE